MNVFRRKMGNGQESPTFYVKMRVAGKQIFRSTGQVEKKAAERWARDYAQELRGQRSAADLAETVRRIRTGGDTISLQDAFARFEKVPQRRPASEGVRQQKASIWSDFLAFMAGEHSGVATLADVTREHASAYIMHLQTAGRYERVVRYRRGRTSIVYQSGCQAPSTKTVNVSLVVLRQIFDALADAAGLAANPFRAVPALINRPETREPFTQDELRLIGEKADAFLRPLFAIGLYTGLREGDICTLRWVEVNTEAGWITRRMHKTGKTVRIPILPPLAGVLRDLPRTGEFVLPDHAAMYQQNRSGVGYRVSEFLESLGIVTARPVEGRSRRVSVKDVHSLRHTFVWLAARYGVPLPVVQSVVGHVTPSMTLLYSNHADDAAKLQHLGVLPDLLAATLPPTAGV